MFLVRSNGNCRIHILKPLRIRSYLAGYPGSLESIAGILRDFPYGFASQLEMKYPGPFHRSVRATIGPVFQSDNATLQGVNSLHLIQYPELSQKPYDLSRVALSRGSVTPGNGFKVLVNSLQHLRGFWRRLGHDLADHGSDFRHLAKATYYVSNADASGKLNQLRPTIYDPARPPSASKAMVQGVAMPDRTITIDMIAAPAARR